MESHGGNAQGHRQKFDGNGGWDSIEQENVSGYRSSCKISADCRVMTK